jgi:benzoate membrane transport protein
MTDRLPDDGSGPGRSAAGGLLQPIGAALSLTVIFIAVLAIPLGTAADLGLSADEATAWIMAIYGVPGVLAVLLVLRYRQPLLLTGNVFVLIFIARLGTELAWSELIGASMVAGVVVLAMGPLGLTKRLIAWLPGPIVFGLLSGAVLPFFVEMFTELGNEPLLVGGTILVFLVAKRFLEPRLPAILPALVTALTIAALSGDLSGLSLGLAIPSPDFTAPSFTLDGILTVTPVMVVLISVQANVPSLVYLEEQGYRPPEAVVGAVSGAGTVAGSLLGPLGASLSLPATALVAGPDAGAPPVRHYGVFMAEAVAIVIAVLAGFFVDLATQIPAVLLTLGVGLAVVGVLVNALREVTTGTLVWGPVFALAIALSDLTLLGLGSFFWAIVGGMVVSALLEREQWAEIHRRHAA